VSARVTLRVGYAQVVRRRPTTRYEWHHDGWDDGPLTVDVAVNGASCTAERRVQWSRHHECEIEHTRLDWEPAECRAFTECLRAAVPLEGAPPHCGETVLDGESYDLAFDDGALRSACTWAEPPPCVRGWVRRADP
jgi:hypothetical protein